MKKGPTLVAQRWNGRTGLAIANGNQAFVYDDLYRLTSATGPYGTLTYAYDQIGIV